MTIDSRGLAASILLALMALVSASAAVAPASEGGGAQLAVQAGVGPEGFNASFTVVVPLPPNATSPQSLGGGVDFYFDRGSCSAGLNGSLELSSPSLENITLTALASGSVEGAANLSNATVEYAYNTTSTLALDLQTVDSGGNPVEASLEANLARSVQGEASRAGGGESSSQSSYQATVNLYLDTPNGTMLGSLQVWGSSQSGAAANSSWGSGDYSGILNLNYGGYSLNVEFDGNYSYLLNLTSGEGENATLLVAVNSTTYFHFNNYLYALAFYNALEAIVENLSLQDYVTLTPPSLFNPTVGVIVEYEGEVGLENLTNATLPGAPGWAWGNATTPTPPGWLRGLLPSLEGSISGSLTYNASVSVENSTLEAAVEASASLSGSPCNSSYGLERAWLDVGLDDSSGSLVVSGGAEGYSAEPFTSGLLAARSLHRLLEGLEGNLSNASIALTGCCGVEFDVNGTRSPSLTFDLGNYSVLGEVGVYYQGALLREPGGLLQVGPDAPGNITLPPIAGGVEASGVYSLNVSVPMPAPATVERALRITFYNDVADNATLLIRRGAQLSGALHLATTAEPPAEASSYGEAAGPTLVVDGVSGNVTIVLPYNGDPDRAALLVVHSNGQVEVVSNVTVEGGYIIANTTASSTYTPIELYSGGQPPSNTTTTTTGTTGTSPETTTTPQETQPPTTTTGETGTTTTSTAPATTTGGGGQTTTPTQAPTRTQTSTSTTGGGGQSSSSQSSAPPAGGSPTTTGKTGHGAALAAAVVAIIVIVAAAAVLLRR
ncbi:MAG: hypothetical protein LRS49_00950 [Desulfurococcales archaeon]|nr:hypothetical protein [Desulfurococcales archaeon]